MDNKFTLSEASAEETEAFKEGLDELLTKFSLSLSLLINKKGIAIKTDDGKVESGFIDQPTLLIQKKTPTVEEPVIKDAENEPS